MEREFQENREYTLYPEYNDLDDAPIYEEEEFWDQNDHPEDKEKPKDRSSGKIASVFQTAFPCLSRM